MSGIDSRGGSWLTSVHFVNNLVGFAVGFDGVYVGAPPNLLFIPDKNKDDKADEKDIKILLFV